MAYRWRYRRSYKRRYRGRRKYRSRFTRKLARSIAQKDTCRLILSSKPTLISAKFLNVDAQTGLYQTQIAWINPMLELVGYTPTGGQQQPGLASFENFRSLFDQFKVNAIRVKVQIVAQPNGSSGYTAMVVRSAIDRNGLAPAFNTALISQSDADPTTVSAADKIFESYSSFNSKIINSSDLYSLYRTFYPVGRERGQWYGASFNYTGIANKNEANLSNIIYPFRPILMIQFMSSNLPVNAANEVYNISFDYDITFKGQRNIAAE